MISAFDSKFNPSILFASSSAILKSSIGSRLSTLSKPKTLYISTDFTIYNEFNERTKNKVFEGDKTTEIEDFWGVKNRRFLNMATITVSLPKEFEEAKKKFPETDWNEVLKAGILKRLEELKKFEELKKRGEL